MKTLLITREGFEKLQKELNFLWKEERPETTRKVSWAASLGDRSENADYIYGKKRLREIDRRMAWLTKRIENAQVVDPRLNSDTVKIVFGATVTYENEEGETATIQIVGEDEIETPKGKISWKSPLARALLNKQVGDEVLVKKPKTQSWIEILSVEYK